MINKKKIVSVIIVFTMILSTFLSSLGTSKVNAAITYVWEKYNSQLTQEYQAVSVGSLGNQYGGRQVYPGMSVDKKTGQITLTGDSYYSVDGGYYYSGGSQVVYRYVSRDSCDNWENCYTESHNSIIYGARLQPVYVKGESTGTFVNSTYQYTYPNNGRHTDGFWYVSLGANTEPVLTVNQSGNKNINLKPGSDTFTLSGTISDTENDNVTLSAAIGNVKKEVLITDTRSKKNWSLVWRTSEFEASRSYNGVLVTATDAKGGTSSLSYNGNVSVDTTKLYYWDKYSTKNKTTSYRQSQGTTDYGYFDNIRGYRDYTFNSSTGQFSGVGEYDVYPTYPTWAGSRLYDIYGERMYENIVTNSQGVQRTAYVAIPDTVTKVRDSLLQSNILDLDKTYPDDGLHTDNYWYVKKATNNMFPVLTVENSDQLIGMSSKKITLRGTAFDSDGDKVSITATLGGKTKTTSVTGSGDWVLEWGVEEVQEGTYTQVDIKGDDGKQGTDTITYNGRIIFDMVPPEQPEVSLSEDVWTNKNVMLFVKDGKDIGSGSDFSEYTKDGDTWHKYNEPVVIDESGEWTYRIRTIDKAGNIGELSEIIVRVDKDAPTAPELHLSTDAYTQEPVTITLTDGQDDLSGVAKSQIKVGSGSWTTYTDPISIDVEGITDVWGRTQDHAGNFSEEIHKQVFIDRTAPTAPIYTVTNTSWTNQDVTFSLSGSQDATDVTYEYKIDDGSFTAGDQGIITESGAHTITARAIDAVGLISPEIQFTVQVDKELPEVTLSPNGLSWSPKGTDVQVEASDRLSGVVEPIYYEISQNEQPSGAWQVLPDSGQVKVNDQEGTWYVHTQVTDQAGNIGTSTSSTYQLQETPETPTLEATALSASEVRLQWSLPGGNRYTDGYTYTIKNLNTGQETTLAYPEHEYVDRQLHGGQDYQYQLTVRNHVGSAEAQATALTYPESPGVEISPVFRTPGEMVINIDPVPSATAYRLVLIDSQGQTRQDGTISNTQHTLTGLDPGNHYTVQVSAVNSSGTGVATSVGFLTLPDTPNGFTAAEIREDRVKTQWQSVTTATYYDLYRDNNLLFNGSDQDLSYEDVGLTAGTGYAYTIAAGNETGEGEITDPLELVTLPAQDTSLQIQNHSTAGFTAMWNGVQSAHTYHLTVTDLQGMTVADYQGADLQYNVSGLAAGTEYEVSLVAINATGQGRAQVLRTVTRPEQVGTVEVSGIEEVQAEINLSSVTGATYYQIELQDGTVYTTSDMHYVMTGLKGSTIYTGSVRAGNRSGLGEPITFNFTTKPARPMELKVVSVGETELTLQWAVDATAGRYWVTDEQQEVAEVTESSIQMTGLKPGTEYRFTVAAENGTGKGLASEIVWSTKTEAPEVKQLDAEYTTASIAWTEPYGAYRYLLKDEATGHVYYNGLQAEVELDSLQAGHAYNLTLYAMNKMGDASEGVPVKVVTRAELSEANGKITNVKATSITIELQTAGQAIKEYVILRDQQEVGTASVGSGQIIYVDTKLKPGTLYTYDVVPVNESGEGRGIQLSATTATESVSAKEVDVKTGNDWAEIRFPVVDHAKEYVVIDEQGTEIWRGSTLPIRIEGLEPGTNYPVKIIVENQEDRPSEAVTVEIWTLPLAPKNITATGTTKSVTLDFKKADAKGVTHWVIYRSGKEIGRVKAGQSQFVDSNVKPATNYEYKVRALNQGGLSKEETTVPVWTQAEPIISDSKPVKEDNPKKEEIVPKENLPEENVSEEKSNSGSNGDEIFKDISTNFAKNEIESLAKDGIIKGINFEMFAPDKLITRMEFAALIVRTLAVSPDESITLSFKDVNVAAWYATELKAAITNGIAKGFSPVEFRPEGLVNREQAAKMLINVILRNGVAPGVEAQQFIDESEIAVWAASDVKMATELQLVRGYPDNTFRPKNGLTRAEAASLIYRLREYLYLVK